MSSESVIPDELIPVLAKLETEFIDLGGDPTDLDNVLKESTKLSIKQRSLLRGVFQQTLPMWEWGTELEVLVQNVTEMVECIPSFNEIERTAIVRMIVSELALHHRKFGPTVERNLCNCIGSQQYFKCTGLDDICSSVEVSKHKPQKRDRLSVEFPDCAEDKIKVTEKVNGNVSQLTTPDLEKKLDIPVIIVTFVE